MKYVFLLLLFSFTVTYSQERFIEGKEIKSGIYKGKRVEYFDQLVSFYLKKIIPLDSAEILPKRYGGKLLQYDPEEGFTLLEFKKGMDILKKSAEFEKDSSVYQVAPVFRRITIHKSAQKILDSLKLLEAQMDSSSQKKKHTPDKERVPPPKKPD